MSSPFPGMDPYLEDARHWDAFQHQLVACLYQMLLPGFVDRYRARVVPRTYTTEMPLFTSILRETHTEECIEIRHRTDSALVTLIDVASPTNKTTAAGRAAYLAKRREARLGRAHTVEIDLVLQGEPLLEMARDGLPPYHYAVTVTRAGHADRHEVYTALLAKRLPKFGLPLDKGDRDAVVDLQSVFARAFDQGGFAAAINYKAAPPPPLAPADAAWLDGHLRAEKRR